MLCETAINSVKKKLKKKLEPFKNEPGDLARGMLLCHVNNSQEKQRFPEATSCYSLDFC